MMAVVRRYALFLCLCVVNALLLLLEPQTGRAALTMTGKNLVQMLTFLPPIFVMLGLLDVWVDRETMMKYMGDRSGLRGMALAFALGTATAGPLYAAFPVVAVMLKKGASLLNVFLFVGAWSTTRAPLILFETATLGARFTVLRLLFNVAGVILVAFLLNADTRRVKPDIPALGEGEDARP